jgi:hypothetical protein
MNSLNKIFFVAVAVLLAGCASVNKELYSWGPYEPLTYAYFRGESPEKQITELEKHMNIAKSKGEKLPPGFYAHLGMLYSKLGKQEEMMQMFDAEKAAFPESNIFITKLNNGFKVEK